MIGANNLSADQQLNSSSNQDLTHVYVALGITHLLVVVIPSVAAATAVLYYIYRIAKESGLKPVTLLYAFVAILCIIGPLCCGILSDISIITNIPIFGNCSSSYQTHVLRVILFFGIHTTIMVVIALISAVQLLIVTSQLKINLQMVSAVFVFVVIYSIGIHAIRFNGDYREIRGSYCTQDGTTAAINNSVLIFISFVIPLAITAACSVLTCLKVKNTTISIAGTSAIKSVIALNTFNIVSYLVLRIPTFTIYFLGKYLNDQSQNVADEFVITAQYFGDLNYPLTAFSIIILHSGVRQMALSCSKTRLTSPTPSKRSETNVCIPLKYREPSL